MARLMVLTGTNPTLLPPLGLRIAVNADQLTARIKQRSPRITWINCCIGLNHIHNFGADERLDGASEGTDHASRKRLIESEWVADSKDLLAHFQTGRLTQCQLRPTRTALGSP